jgi:ribosomal protein S18 acetylase RimI-like enzyme
MVRRAQITDVPAIIELIQELASYEREPDAVDATEETLREALFGPHPMVFAHVVEHDGVVVGCAVWFVNFSTWTSRHGIYLEDLVVREGYRGRGYGKQLLVELARIAVARDYARFEWSVLDWNEPAIGFYRAIGAAPMGDWTVYRLSGAPLEALAAT